MKTGNQMDNQATIKRVGEGHQMTRKPNMFNTHLKLPKRNQKIPYPRRVLKSQQYAEGNPKESRMGDFRQTVGETADGVQLCCNLFHFIFFLILVSA